jgi:hypothetical protein
MFECITADDLNAWKERIILDVRPALPPTSRRVALHGSAAMASDGSVLKGSEIQSPCAQVSTGLRNF